SEAYAYDADGNRRPLLKRETPYPGKCVMHKPWIGETLPVYVWDRYEEFDDVRPMIELDDATIENYLQRNVTIVERVVREYGIKALHANHAVLMSVVAERVSRKTGIPFAIMPHGSAIEYAVKKDKRFFNYALQAFDAAAIIFVIGQEIRQRVIDLFPQIQHVHRKMVTLNLGVDTSLFRLLPPEEKPVSVGKLMQVLPVNSQGKSEAQAQNLFNGLKDDLTLDEMLRLIEENHEYDGKQPDQNAAEKLQTIRWGKEPVVLFVGRIIASKGLHLILAALPLVLKNHPNLRMVVVGHGPLREPLEAFVRALESGNLHLVRNIVRWGLRLEGGPAKPFEEIALFFNRLERDGQLNNYFHRAQQYLRSERIVFTGYLRHKELRYLFPACDVAVFPSIVAEAGPLVFLEALACGCFPIGTYFAGMAASIDSLQGAIPDPVREIMKLSVEKDKVVSEIADKIGRALEVDDDIRGALRRVAVEKYDWQNISKKYLRAFSSV
ncbi:MAG TPA: glycosyltransferase, partial [Caldithrix abyssi]|nr:glycosyltransferase [Caldithrix abyssi]